MLYGIIYFPFVLRGLIALQVFTNYFLTGATGCVTAGFAGATSTFLLGFSKKYPPIAITATTAAMIIFLVENIIYLFLVNVYSLYIK